MSSAQKAGDFFMGGMKDYLMSLQRGEPWPQEPCPRCGKPTRNGYCYYCGTGERPPARSAEARNASIGRALELWEETLPVAGTMVEYYLQHHRRIAILPPNVDVALRFHPGCPFGKSYVPSMVALLRDVVSDTPCGIHRTHIDREYPGKLAVPRVLGQFKGAAIKLWPTPDHGRLLVGEGIETTLSAAQHLDISPAWALGTAYNLSNFPVLETVTELHIAVDNDAAGQSAAKLCASRYYGHGREKVYLHTPKQHNDFNDVILSLCHGR